MTSQEEKDRMKEEAYKAYVATYVGRGGTVRDMERYYVSKGIEAMAAIVFEKEMWDGG